MQSITTDRLCLRAFLETDIPVIYAIFSDVEVNRFLPWFPLQSPEEATAFYNQRLNASTHPGREYAICFRNDNIPVGYITVSGEDSHDFGYGLRKEFWHQGIVTEAGKAVIEELRKDEVPFITATHDVNNPASGKVMQRLGMTYQYSYEELWQPKNFLVTFRMYQLNLDENKDRIYRKYWEMYPVHYIEKI